MRQSTFNKLLAAALSDPEVQAAFSRAVNLALEREIKISRKGPEDEHPAVSVERANMVDMVATYLPRVEGAVRGAQAASEQARNRSAEVRDMVGRRLVPALAAAFNKDRLLIGNSEDAEIVDGG